MRRGIFPHSFHCRHPGRPVISGTETNSSEMKFREEVKSWALFCPNFPSKSSRPFFQSSLFMFSQCLSIFPSFLFKLSSAFTRSQSVLVNYSPTSHTRQKRRNFLPTRRWGKTTPKKSIAFLGAIAFLQHAPKKSSASKMEGFP